MNKKIRAQVYFDPKDRELLLRLSKEESTREKKNVSISAVLRKIIEFFRKEGCENPSTTKGKEKVNPLGPKSSALIASSGRDKKKIQRTLEESPTGKRGRPKKKGRPRQYGRKKSKKRYQREKARKLKDSIPKTGDGKF